MTATTRTTPRSPGRTPPFVLVGLLVIVGFLAYSYWSQSSTNNQLSAELESILLEKKDVDTKNSELEKNAETTLQELRSAKDKLEVAKKQVSDKDSEINSLRNDVKNKQADADKFKTQLGQCDASLTEIKSSLETLKNEKAELEKKRSQAVCDVAGCIAPIKEVLAVAAKVAGSDALKKVLTDAKYEGAKLLEGVQVPAPGGQQKANENPQPVSEDPKQAAKPAA